MEVFPSIALKIWPGEKTIDRLLVFLWAPPSTAQDENQQPASCSLITSLGALCSLVRVPLMVRGRLPQSLRSPQSKSYYAIYPYYLCSNGILSAVPYAFPARSIAYRSNMRFSKKSAAGLNHAVGDKATLLPA
jgi:hypothetical protein